MKLYRLETVSWQDSQLLYHAQPRLDREGLNFLAPATSYVCIGYFQDVEQEVDVAYCREHGIPIFRREVGGGAVFLDGEQLFYQLVIHRDNPLTPASKEAFYRKFLQAPIEAYRALGIPAEYKPINDIVANGRKVSGTGVAEIGDYIVFVGNLIADFDYETTSHVLRVPDAKYRDKVFQSMRENLTTLRRELGRLPSWDEMAEPLIRRFAEVLGPLQENALPQAVYDEVEALKPLFQRAEWLYKKGRREADRTLKIATGVNVVQRMHKAPGGLIRTTVEIRSGQWGYVSLSGDFFCHPREAIGALESALEGTSCAEVRQVIERFYATHKIDTPGVTTDDWVAALPEVPPGG
jgi:lipoate-protein ligase A